MDGVLVEKQESDSEISKKINEKLKLTFSRIYEELEDHLDSINENTNEIQANYAYLCEIDNKISKLSERIDEISLTLKNLTGQKIKKQSTIQFEKLTKIEQNIFLVLLNEKQQISCLELSKKTNIPLTLIREYILIMIEKGIPIQRAYIESRPYVFLKEEFKKEQLKKQLIKLEQKPLNNFFNN